MIRRKATDMIPAGTEQEPDAAEKAGQRGWSGSAGIGNFA